MSKFEYKKSVIKLKFLTNNQEVFNKSHTCLEACKSEWICKNCHRSFSSKNRKISMQAQANNLKLCHKIGKLEDLSSLELMLISQIIPLMFIAKVKGAQYELKGQCVLVSTDKKWKGFYLGHRLTDKSSINKKYIQPATVNRALTKLT